MAMVETGNVMTTSLKGTVNQTGFEMAETNPLLADFVSAYDGLHPLLDIGCAYGRNVAAAVRMLGAGHVAPDPRLQVVACDCALEHLEAVDALEIPQVTTIYGKLPLDLEDVKGLAKELGGFSGILVSEVLHFLSGEEIKESIETFKELLVPGGRLCITMFSPLANISGSNCPVADFYRQSYAERESAGCKWPGEDINLKKLIRELQASLASDERAMSCFPSYFHVVSATQMKLALEAAGFKILLAQEDRHPGHAPHFHNDGRESTQVVAFKPTLEMLARGGA